MLKKSVLVTAAAVLLLPLVGMGSLAARAGELEGLGAAAGSADLVVLVHGMGRTKLSMLPLEWALEREGYEVLNWGYSSTCCTVAELSDRLSAELDAHENIARRRVHFVGHSLGNIIVRSVLATDPPAKIGRVVMLAPPNQGSRAADRFAGLLGWLLRPLPELTSAATSTARRLTLPARVEVGVIAGAYDAKVSVAESHLAGEADHVVVPSAHTFVMARGDVHRLTFAFLREGRFGREAPAAHPGAHRAVEQDLTR